MPIGAIVCGTLGPEASHAKQQETKSHRRPAEPAPIDGMIPVPGAEIVLGSDFDDMAWSAALCNRRVGRPICEPTDFDAELSRDNRVRVKDFAIDRTEVSRGQYARCVSAGACHPPRLPLRPGEDGTPREELPVVGVNFYDAREYCRFVDARLPTEAEFELAARGPERRRYPWGDLFHAGRVNGGSWGPAKTDDKDGYELWAPTLSFFDGRTPSGILNLAGNVAEWTSTQYHVYGSEQYESRHVVRGGHFGSPPWELRAAFRWPAAPTKYTATIGFRCARSTP